MIHGLLRSDTSSSSQQRHLPSHQYFIIYFLFYTTYIPDHYRRSVITFHINSRTTLFRLYNHILLFFVINYITNCHSDRLSPSTSPWKWCRFLVLFYFIVFLIKDITVYDRGRLFPFTSVWKRRRFYFFIFLYLYFNENDNDHIQRSVIMV